MDIIHSKNPLVFTKPAIIKLGNHCFRTFQTEVKEVKDFTKLSPYNDNDEDLINCAELEDDIEIKITKTGKFVTQIHVASYFFGSIIGSRGTKKKQIEIDTSTVIKIPKQGDCGDIIITGTSERDVISACNRIQLIVLRIRDTHPITHFISIPICSSQIKNSFEVFKTKILNGPPLRGVDESIFQNPDKLHLTISTLVLLDDVEKELAIQTLHECKEELDVIFKKANDKLQIILEGLEIMNDDPTDVHVLYGKVKLNIPKYNASLQKMADYIVSNFSKKGLIRNQYENVKLHVTLMNSTFRKHTYEEEKRVPFDCSYILKNFKNYNFGLTDFKNVHLSIRFTSDETNYYEPLAVLSL